MQRVSVAFFHIVTQSGQDLGWVGYCEQLDEAMVPALLHMGGEDGAKKRAETDPPKPLSFHGGKVFAPASWMLKALRDETYVPVVKAMNHAARAAFADSKTTGARPATPGSRA